jgi:RHS repeat-associated protein
MKRQIHHTIWFLALLALLSAPHLASAYYDPGVQRWVNRDPVGDPGFEALRGRKPTIVGDGPNLYAFIHNDPLQRTDALGLARAHMCPQKLWRLGDCLNQALHKYKAALKKADRDADDCYDTCMGMSDPHVRQSCIDNCQSINKIDDVAAAAKYLTDSLECLAGTDVQEVIIAK